MTVTDPAPASRVPRVVCTRCRRPQIVCYCAALPHLPTQTRVVILQHPRERDMPIGTARMASLCLPNSELHVGVDWGRSAALASALADPARPPILLYPGAGARDILAEPPIGPVTLVVVDGTWSQAKTVVRDNPVLHALPRYAFATPEPSQYRIRREPDPAYCSTIEALMYVLGALEGEPERFRALLDPLNAMVDAQLACQQTRGVHRSRAARAAVPLSQRLPPALRERFADLVLVVGEANAWPYRLDPSLASGRLAQDKEPDELIHWVAYRPASGELVDRIAAPRRTLSPSTTFHSELPEDVLRGGHSIDEVLAAHARFARPHDIVASWGHYGPDLFRDAGGVLGERVDLRATGHGLLHRRFGSLETYAETLPEISVPSVWPAGRAGRRLAALARIVAAWRTL